MGEMEQIEKLLEELDNEDLGQVVLLCQDIMRRRA